MKKRTAIRTVLVGLAALLMMSLTSCMAMMRSLAEELLEANGYYDASYSSGSPVSAGYNEPVCSQYAGSEAGFLDSQIIWVWQQCEREGIRDYDGNGEVNCCDRATAFCIKWRRTYSRSIRLCQQSTLQLNHMYVQLYVSGYGWWSVDPCYSESGTHDMKMVWGRRYSRAYDVSDAYWVNYFSRYIR
ncbi:MAG: hypothetical protein ILP18_10885 [Treponema sp.]|nr:hypothetical protein [Treponema sp.]